LAPRLGGRARPAARQSGSLLIADGQSIKAVSMRLGHDDISITLKVYCHCLPNDDVKLASTAAALLG
jgi:integrase